MADGSWPARRFLDLHSEVAASGLALKLETYWQAVRHGRQMPARRDVDPTALCRMLPNVFLIDVVGRPPRFRWRLIGTKIVDTMRAEHTGKWLDDTLAEAEDPFLAFCRMSVNDRRPTCHIARWQDLDGRTKPLMRGLLPLSEDGHNVTMLFGVIDYAPGEILLLQKGAA
jgi:hypothetical protein